MYVIQSYFAEYFHYLYRHKIRGSYSWDTRSKSSMHPDYYLVKVPTKRHARICIQRLKTSDYLMSISYYPNVFSDRGNLDLSISGWRRILKWKEILVGNMHYLPEYQAIFRQEPPRKYPESYTK